MLDLFIHFLPLQTRLAAGNSRQRPVCAAPDRQVRSLAFKISARRSGVKGLVLVSPTISCEQRAQQNVGRTFGEDEQTLLPLGVGVNRRSSTCARKRRELRRRARSARRGSSSSPLCARRPSVRLRSGRPARSSARRALAARRCWRGRPVKARCNSSEAPLHRRRTASTSTSPSGAYPVPAEIDATTRRDDRAHRHFVFGQRPVLSEAMTLAEPRFRPPRDDARWRCAWPYAARPEQDRCHHRRQTFRHRRDRQRHAKNEDIEESEKPRTSSTRMIVTIITTAMTTTTMPSILPTRVEFLLQRRGFLRSLLLTSRRCAPFRSASRSP